MAKKRPRKGKRSSKGTRKNKPTKAARSAPKIPQGREATVHSFVPHAEGRGACSAPKTSTGKIQKFKLRERARAVA
jgi:hypothetical protein